MIDLGYMNGWGMEYPPLYKESVEKGYTFVERAISRCLTRYTCEELGFFFYVDSSDREQR